MINVLNEEFREIFSNEWRDYLKYLANNDRPLPKEQGIGWASSVACYHNLCSAICKEDGKTSICAAPLWKHPGTAYLCAGHKKEYDAMVENNGGHRDIPTKKSDIEPALKRLIEDIKSRL